VDQREPVVDVDDEAECQHIGFGRWDLAGVAPAARAIPLIGMGREIAARRDQVAAIYRYGDSEGAARWRRRAEDLLRRQQGRRIGLCRDCNRQREQAC